MWERDGKEYQKPQLPALGHKWTPVQKAALNLYMAGYNRPQVMQKLWKHLIKNSGQKDEQKLKALARNKLREWERSQWFRDALWEGAVVQLDLDTPSILKGITKKARNGQVDPAKLVLGITGRYPEKADQSPTAVTVVFGGLPRPQVIDGEVTDEE